MGGDELERVDVLVNNAAISYDTWQRGAEGAASVLWAVVLPDGGPTGGSTRDGRPLPW